MPIIDDPTSPIGKTIPLLPTDISRLRKGAADNFVADKAYNLDPQFRSLADHYFKPEINSQLDEQSRTKLPTMLLNMHYFGKPVMEQTDDLGAEIANPQDPNSFNPFSPQNQKPQRPLEEVAPVIGGIAGSFGGPLGTFAGTAVGAGVEHLVKGLKGEKEPSLTEGVAMPLVKGAVAGLTHLAANKAIQGATSLIKPPSVQDIVQPKVTESTLREAVAKTPDLVKKGIFGDAKILPDQAAKRLEQTASTIKGFGKSGNPIKNAQIVKKTIGDEASALKSAFKANDAALPHQEINAAIDQRLVEVAKDFPGEEAAINRMGELWKRATEKMKGTISGHWDGRIEFDADVESRFGEKIFEKGTARAEAVRAIRQTANSVIDSAAKKAGLSYTPQINRLSDMYDILENLSTKATKAGNLSKALKSPLGRGVAIGAGATALGIGGLRSLTD